MVSLLNWIMKKMSKTIVFFGSGPVAAKSLLLLSKDFEIEAVITKPGMNKRDPVPVMDLSEKLGLKTLTPSNKNELNDLFKTRPVKSQVAVLIDYGIIVSQEVIDYFPLGIVNSHFSLLPEWRGADPITFSILSGQKETGVSLMLINAQMDEGKLLSQASIRIDNLTGPELTDKLISLSHKMLSEFLPKYISNTLTPYDQDSSIKPTYSRKLTKSDGHIDWNKSAEQLSREVRAYVEWPKSHTNIVGKDVVITKAHSVNLSGEPGKVEADKNSLTVFTGEGALVIDRLKPLGKSEMDSKAFISGYLRPTG